MWRSMHPVSVATHQCLLLAHCHTCNWGDSTACHCGGESSFFTYNISFICSCKNKNSFFKSLHKRWVSPDTIQFPSDLIVKLFFEQRNLRNEALFFSYQTIRKGKMTWKWRKRRKPSYGEVLRDHDQIGKHHMTVLENRSIQKQHLATPNQSTTFLKN